MSAKLFKWFLWLAIPFCLMEPVSRLIVPTYRPYFQSDDGQTYGLKMADPELHHRLRPNLKGRIMSPEYRHAFSTDSLGFRGRNSYSDTSEASFKIFSFGDNFALGKGVEIEETYAELVAQKLKTQTDDDVLVYNFGVSSYGTLQQLELFKRFTYLKPDLVLIAFFARDTFSPLSGNDLTDNYFYQQKIERPGATELEATVRHQDPPLRRMRSFFLRNSNFYRFFELKLNAILRKNYKPPDDPERLQEAWHITGRILREFDDLLEEHNSTGLILWIPYMDTIVKKDHSISKKIMDLRLHRIWVVDMLTAMQSKPEQYYSALDNHFTKAGHRLAAKLILERLEDRLNANQTSVLTAKAN